MCLPWLLGFCSPERPCRDGVAPFCRRPRSGAAPQPDFILQRASIAQARVRERHRAIMVTALDSAGE
jgi:hypothetical protein